MAIDLLDAAHDIAPLDPGLIPVWSAPDTVDCAIY